MKIVVCKKLCRLNHGSFRPRKFGAIRYLGGHSHSPPLTHTHTHTQSCPSHTLYSHVPKFFGVYVCVCMCVHLCVCINSDVHPCSCEGGRPCIRTYLSVPAREVGHSTARQVVQFDIPVVEGDGQQASMVM